MEEAEAAEKLARIKEDDSGDADIDGPGESILKDPEEDVIF